MSGTPAAVRVDRRGHTCVITMDRPEAMNAINAHMTTGLVRAVADFVADDDLLVGVLTGAGGRAFCADADLREVASGSAPGAERDRRGFAVPRLGSLRPFDDVSECPKPVIAAIDGYCLAGGFELALLCDIRLATRSSTFGLPEPRVGMMAGPGLHNLSRMIPLGEALRVQLTGGRMTADRAYPVGLVQELVDDREALIAAALSVDDEIAECSPTAVRAIKHVVKVGRNLPIEYAWALADPYQDALSRSPEAFEGPRAFAEKRAPLWSRA